MSKCGCGPGFGTPKEATGGPRETIVYVLCIQTDPNKPDYLSTVDVDPKSSTYSQVIHRLPVNHNKDEMHHFGWNACSSCHGDDTKKRDKLIIPCLGSDRIYIVDTSNERSPTIYKVIEPEEMHKYGVSAPHTTHCLPSGEVMISTLGDENENARGQFLLLDTKEWKFTGLWTRGTEAKFGYDFWYQPFWNIMVASEWTAPKYFRHGIKKSLRTDEMGKSLNFYNWKERTLQKTIDLGLSGIYPLEIRFLHDPKASVAYVGSAYQSFLYRIFRQDDGEWNAEKVVSMPNIPVNGWLSKHLTGMITDILISLDDKFLYLSNWLHGDIRQYDITQNPPKLLAQLYVGGLLVKGSHVTPTDESLVKEPLILKGRRVYGGPQMLQLSLDGKRLYVTNSLYSSWDKEIYPDMVQNGSCLLKVDVDNEKGGLKLDEDFVVHYGLEPDGPVLAHECRYPGGDCSSDIWLAE